MLGVREMGSRFHCESSLLLYRPWRQQICRSWVWCRWPRWICSRTVHPDDYCAPPHPQIWTPQPFLPTTHWQQLFLQPFRLILHREIIGNWSSDNGTMQIRVIWYRSLKSWIFDLVLLFYLFDNKQFHFISRRVPLSCGSGLDLGLVVRGAEGESREVDSIWR